jgi:hypothetical protein
MDKDERSPRNVALARELGEKYGPVVSSGVTASILVGNEWWRPAFRYPRLANC